MSTRHPFDLTLAELHRLNLDADPHLEFVLLGTITNSFVIEIVLTYSFESHHSCSIAPLSCI